jgi:hypothetical protein
MADTVTLPPPSPPLPWWVQPGLAFLLLGGFLGICFIIVLRSDDKYEQIVLIALIGMVTGTIGYYFGASSGQTKQADANTALAGALATSTPIATTSSVPEPSEAEKALAAKLPA